MAEETGPGVRVPPPLLFIVPLLTGFVIQRLVPIRLAAGHSRPTLAVVGWGAIAIALACMAWAVSTFKRLRTPIIPVRRATTLAEAGPYQFTRNPMYLSFTVLYLGIAFVADAVWPLLFLPASVALVYWVAIRKEESHLRREFGAAYDAYRKRVRRWI
jgi:protein-S-isoprenylcysteine O-methyltransferase Ste14